MCGSEDKNLARKHDWKEALAFFWKLNFPTPTGRLAIYQRLFNLVVHSLILEVSQRSVKVYGRLKVI